MLTFLRTLERPTVRGARAMGRRLESSHRSFQGSIQNVAAGGSTLDLVGVVGAPMEISAAAAVDIPLFSSSQQGRVVDTTSGTPVASSFAFPGVPYRAV